VPAANPGPGTGGVVVRNIRARARLLSSIAIGAALYLALPAEWRSSTRALIGWNTAATLYVAASFFLTSGARPDDIRRHALDADEGRIVALALAIVAAVAAFVAIVAQLTAVKEAKGVYHAMHLALACVTIVSAWTFTHLMFAQHYAHEYFIERESELTLPEEFRSGLHFPGAREPAYSDFVYFAFVIGVASQTADVEITSSVMRRISLLHSLLSFVFNTAILALSINIASGLIAP
jgi:uncharacterized membrane protein